MSHIFISYSKQDIGFARHLRHLLQDQGFAVWMDETRLVPSEKWWARIERNIISCAAFIVIMSSNGKESEWIEREILVAEDRSHRKPIFPVLLEGKRWARLGNLQYQDMRQGIAVMELPVDFVDGLQQYVPFDDSLASLPGIEIEEPPSLAHPARQRWLLIAAVLVLIIGAGSLVAILTRGATATAAQTMPTDDVTATIVAGVAATIAQQTQIALAATPTPTFTLTVTDNPTEIPLNVETAIAATFTGEALQTANAPTVTSTFTDTPDIQATVVKAVEGTRIANAVVLYTATPDPFVKVTSNAEWSPSQTVVTFNGFAMVLVPAGCFVMGSDRGDDDEQPIHRVCFDAPFWIDQYEVTNRQFGSEDNNKPHKSISWTAAATFCQQREARLPTEAEWEYAARGPDGLSFPWGNTFVAENVTYYGNSGAQTAEVGSKQGGVSWVGAYDLSGNVWEWVADWYGMYATGEQINPQGTRQGSYRVLRGGSWENNINNTRATNRSWFTPDYGINNIGLRCARSF
jgi:formylglycine-generating enzyme required for sulfatase activity